MTVGGALAGIGAVLFIPSVVLWITFGATQSIRFGWKLRERVLFTVATVTAVASITLFILGIIFSIE